VDGDGSINSQVIFNPQIRADKKRFFKHPGFIIGLQVVKPKVYISNRQQSAISMLDDLESWLSPTMQENAGASIIKLDVSATPEKSPYDLTDFEVQTTPVDYYMDVRDLYIHGDEFVQTNGTAPTIVGSPPLVARIIDPDGTDVHVKKYLDEADLTALYDTTPIHVSEGVTYFNIKGRQRDTTPSIKG